MDHNSATKNVRRYNAFMDIFDANYIHLRRPWVVAWWSAAFPGFGHLKIGSYIKGLILILWEIVINDQAKINLAIMYSFTGRYEMAKEVLNTRWMLLYFAVYIVSIWDSYRSTVDLNNIYTLAEREKATIVPFKMNGFGINYLDKRNPWLSMVWSMLMPGLGHLYLQRITTGLFMIVWCIVVAYFSHILQAIQFTLMGTFSEATAILDPQWTIFLPSLYCFAVYESYLITVEYNKLFQKEQVQLIKKNYQDPNFQIILSNQK